MTNKFIKVCKIDSKLIKTSKSVFTFQRREMAKFQDQKKPNEAALPWIPPPIRSLPSEKML